MGGRGVDDKAGMTKVGRVPDLVVSEIGVGGRMLMELEGGCRGSSWKKLVMVQVLQTLIQIYGKKVFTGPLERRSSYILLLRFAGCVLLISPLTDLVEIPCGCQQVIMITLCAIVHDGVQIYLHILHGVGNSIKFIFNSSHPGLIVIG
jgi:hypothetical protein